MESGQLFFSDSQTLTFSALAGNRWRPRTQIVEHFRGASLSTNQRPGGAKWLHILPLSGPGIRRTPLKSHPESPECLHMPSGEPGSSHGVSGESDYFPLVSEPHHGSSSTLVHPGRDFLKGCSCFAFISARCCVLCDHCHSVSVFGNILIFFLIS